MTITSTTATAAGQGQYLLRSIIDAHARSEFRQLDERLFLESELPAYQFVRRFYQAHGTFPTPQACAENGHTLPAGGNPVGYYMERCQNRAVYNAILAEQPGLGEAMLRRDMSLARDTIHSIARSIGGIVAGDDAASLGDLVEEVLHDYEHAHLNPGMQGITLGWPVLDAATGGVEPGDIVTFAARPGMGKSWLLTHIARNAWLAGHSILFVSMEMTGKQIARRFLAMDAGVGTEPIRSGQLSEWSRGMVYDRLEAIRGGPPFHMLTGSFNKSVPLVDAAIQEFSPALVCIDASYLMDPSEKGKGKKQFEALTDVAKEIKQMAMERQKGIIQTVQFNREATKAKRRGTEHIGGTDAVGQITTIGVSIKEGPASAENSKRTLDLFKNREGEGSLTFETEFLFQPPSFEFLRLVRADGAVEEAEQEEVVDPEILDIVGGF